MPIEEKLKQIEAEIGFIIAARINKFITLVNNEIRGRLSFTRITSDLDTLIKFKKKIPTLYRKAGLDTLTKNISAQFPNVAKESIEQTAKDLGVPSLRSGSISEVRKQVLRRTLKGIRSVERSNHRRFRRVLKLKTIKNLSRAEFDKLINATAAHTKAQLQTEATTAVQGYDNMVTTVKANAAGAKRFRYAGPRGGPIRPFCNKRVGKYYTDAQAKKWNNGQGLSAFIYLGGHRCRHRKEYTLD